MVMRGLRIGTGLVVLTLILTGCYKTEFDITVADDGSANLIYIAGLNHDILATAAMADGVDLEIAEDRDEFCADTFDEISSSEGSGSDDITPYDDGSYCGASIKYTAGPGDDPGAELKSGLSSSDETTNLTDWTLVRTGDGWKFEMPFPQGLLDSVTNAEGENGEQLDETSVFLVAQSVDIDYRVELPGKTGDNNASNVDEGQGSTTFEWSIDVVNPPEQLFANTVAADIGSGTTAPTTQTTIADQESTTTTTSESESTSGGDTADIDTADSADTADTADTDGDGDGEDAIATTIDNSSDSDGGLPLVPIGLGGAGLALLAGGGLFFASKKSDQQSSGQSPALMQQPLANAQTVYGSPGSYAGAQQQVPLQQQQPPYQQQQPQQQQQAVAWTPMPQQNQPAGAAASPQAQPGPAQVFTEPEWDPTQACWIVKDNSGRRYRHDAATNQWVPTT